jgi:hypothetical protein
MLPLFLARLADGSDSLGDQPPECAEALADDAEDHPRRV